MRIQTGNTIGTAEVIGVRGERIVRGKYRSKDESQRKDEEVSMSQRTNRSPVGVESGVGCLGARDVTVPPHWVRALEDQIGSVSG